MQLAIKHNLDYAWVDTCCIDKSSSAELSEAINSMYRWYQRSVVCYAYLSDLDPSTTVETGLKDCRWLTRGWTLQELIAPQRFYFYDRDWGCRGSKRRLVELVSNVTGIDVEILLHKTQLSSVPVGRRMAWAAGRQTKRIEDRAYSLLGIFDVNMPLLYGEEEKAFRRLQEEIIKLTPDYSLFAWEMPASRRPFDSKAMVSGILARSPDYFRNCLSLQASTWFKGWSELSILNGRLKIQARLYYGLLETGITHFFLPLGCQKAGGTLAMVPLVACRAREYVRCDPWCAYDYDERQENFRGWATRVNIYILTDVPMDYEVGNGSFGACLMRPFLMERRKHTRLLHIDTPPEMRIVECFPPGLDDRLDQVVHGSFEPSQNPVCIQFNLSIDPEGSRKVKGNQQDHVQVFQYGLVVLNWGNLSTDAYGNTIFGPEQQFTICDFAGTGRKGGDFITYLLERGEDIDDLYAMRWLHDRDLWRVSAIVSPLLERPGIGVRVSVTSEVVNDNILFATSCAALKISWEVGRIKDLPVSEPKKWDLSEWW